MVFPLVSGSLHISSLTDSAGQVVPYSGRVAVVVKVEGTL